MLRVVAPAEAALGRAGGGLYAANTLGAIAGALLAAFLLIPALGVTGAAFVAGLVNLLVGASALWLGSRAAAVPVPAATAPAITASTAAAMLEGPPPAAPPARRALWLYALAGGVALGYEVVWSQAIVQFMSTRAFAFAVMLATYLAGLMLGSALQARYADRLRDPWTVFGLLISGAGLLALGAFGLLGSWLPQLQTAAARALSFSGSELAVMSGRFAVAAGFMVLLPTLLLGAAFRWRCGWPPTRTGSQATPAGWWRSTRWAALPAPC